MCPNWICTVVSPYGEGGGDRKQRPDNAARLGAEGRDQTGGSGGDAGDPARAGGLVLATPRPPAPAAAGAPGSPRAPLPSQHRACGPELGVRAGCWGRGSPSEAIFSTENSKQQAESMQHAAGPGGAPKCHRPRGGPRSATARGRAPGPARCLPRGLGGGQPGGAGRRWAPATRSPAAADGAPRPRTEPAAVPGRGAQPSTGIARPGRKRKRRLRGSPAPASLMNANIYHLHVKV